LAAWSGVIATAIASGCPEEPQGVLQLPEMEAAEHPAWEAALALMQPSCPAAAVTWASAQALLVLADKYDMPGITSQVSGRVMGWGGVGWGVHSSSQII
jgi:hypothetical protein